MRKNTRKFLARQRRELFQSVSRPRNFHNHVTEGWEGGISDENKAGGQAERFLVLGIQTSGRRSSSVRIFEFGKFDGKIFVDNLNLIPAENFQRTMLRCFNSSWYNYKFP